MSGVWVGYKTSVMCQQSRARYEAEVKVWTPKSTDEPDGKQCDTVKW